MVNVRNTQKLKISMNDICEKNWSNTSPAPYNLWPPARTGELCRADRMTGAPLQTFWIIAGAHALVQGYAADGPISRPFPGRKGGLHKGSAYRLHITRRLLSSGAGSAQGVQDAPAPLGFPAGGPQGTRTERELSAYA